jgi:Ca2+-binding EF-hand superfamily protein
MVVKSAGEQANIDDIVENFFVQADTNADGKIDFAEFVAASHLL